MEKGYSLVARMTQAEFDAGAGSSHNGMIEIVDSNGQPTGKIYFGGNAGSVGADVGDIKITAKSTAPVGWLICDGLAISRIDYADLFAAIGTTYGLGDGSTTFNIPNLKGKIPVGYDISQPEFDTLGKTGGAKRHTLSASEMPSHSHSYTDYGGSYVYNRGDVGNQADCAGMGSSNKTTGVAGSGQAHNNLQPYIVMNYLIKY